jgi:hypothetical protein
MKELYEAKFNFQQKKFLKQIDPKVLARAAAEVGKAKAEFHRKRDEEVKAQQKVWVRQAALMREGSTLNMKKAEAEYKRFRASLTKHETAPNWQMFERYTGGPNPLFRAPNFFNPGYGRTVGGFTTYDTWTVNFGGPVRIPYSDPTHGLMGVQISAVSPGGHSVHNTGLSNLFFSQSAQTIPLSASFFVYGWGLSMGFGAGYSRAWVRLGVDAWVIGSGLATRHHNFVTDFWSSVPSPWVFEDRHFRETHSTGTHMISVQPGDLVFGSAVIEQGASCGGLFTGAKSEFLATVTQLEIGP